MRFLGIDLRKPSFTECTSAAVLAVGCWLLMTGLARAAGVAMNAADAGALLLVVSWGVFGARIGVSVDRGGRHLAAHLIIAAVLLAGYESAVLALA